jgi:predicted patatin/cPLA2 family phospholipase
MNVLKFRLKKNSQFVKDLFLKKKLLESGDLSHEKIRTVLLVLGGAMQGANGAGAANALCALGLSQVFDVVVGVSTGAGIGAYFLAGKEQTALGSSIYYEECTLPDFINFYRRKCIANIDFVETILRSGKKKIAVDKIMNSRSMFYVGATRTKDGKGEFINVKTAIPDPISAIKASMAMPGFYGKSVRVNGKLYEDGSPGLPFPVREVVDKFSPTHLLVISNDNLECTYARVVGEKLFARIMLKRQPRMARTMEEHSGKLMESIGYFAKLDGVKRAILFPGLELNIFTQDRRRLKRAIVATARKTLRAFGRRRNFRLANVAARNSKLNESV